MPRCQPLLTGGGVPQAKPLKLPEITRPLPSEEMTRQLTAALDRLLAAEAAARSGGLAAARAKLLAMAAAHFTDELLDSEPPGETMGVGMEGTVDELDAGVDCVKSTL